MITLSTLSNHCRKLVPFHQSFIHPTAGRLHLGGGYLKSRYSLRNQAIAHSFHSSTRLSQPIGISTSGVLAGLFSATLRTYLTGMCYASRTDKHKRIVKMLWWVPAASVVVMLASGLELAPNTSRIRLIYLSKEEEAQLEKFTVSELYEPLQQQMASKDSNLVIWLQNIADNLAKVASDDIHAPVRKQATTSSGTIAVVNDTATKSLTTTTPTSSKEEQQQQQQQQQEPSMTFSVNFVCDNVFNAKCVGSAIFVHSAMLSELGLDETKIAVILSHEIAHSIQRHIPEINGFLMFFTFLGNITRWALWNVTDIFGPHFNDDISWIFSTSIAMEAQTSFNRMLEYEADVVGVFFLAKAGYDPRVALEVWTKIAQREQKAKEIIKKEEDANMFQEAQDWIDNLRSTWFGQTHPDSMDRVKHLEKYMDQATALYEEAIRVNGKAVCVPLEKPYVN